MAITRINNNISAMNAMRNLSRNTADLEKSLERLSSGLRINRASDDASGLSISEKLRSQINGLTQAVKNAQDGVSLVNTAEGALDETTAILQRIRELSVKAANTGGLDAKAIQAAQDEIDSSIQEITRIGTDTQFSTRRLLDGSNGITATAATGYGASVTAGPAVSTLAGGTHYLEVTQTLTGSQAIASGGDASVNIGATATVSGSTFDTGSYDVVVSNVLAAQANVETSDPFVLQADGTAAIGATVLTTVDNGAGVAIAVDDTIEIAGTTANGTAFTATHTVVALDDMDDLVSTIQTAINAADGGTVDDDVTITIVDGALVFTDDVAGASDFEITTFGVDVDGDGGGTPDNDIATTTTTVGRENSATVSVGGGQATTVTSGSTYTLQGPAPSNDLEDTPQISITFGTLTAGTDTLTVVKSEWSGSLDGGTAVAFEDGEDEVVFKNGTTAGFQSGESLSMDFDGSVSAGTVTIEAVNNGLSFHIGANENQNITVSIGDLRSSNLGILSTTGTTVADIDVTTTSGANKAIQIVDEAINQVSRQRSYLGAISNRLEKTINNLNVSAENLTASESRIRDADIASETTRFTRNQILMQAGTSILAQANMAPQSVLQLLG